MTPAPAVVFYISGHGFGHAVRQTAIVNALVARSADAVRVVLRTTAPRWLFARTIRGACEVLSGETDTGVVQIDALRLDEDATVARASSFYRSLPARVGHEAALLDACGARLVVADAPPLACAAAAAAGVPSAVCANFTWDWIYADYLDATTPEPLATIRDAYAQATLGWRLPMHGGFGTVPAITDVPLVARHARPDRSPDEVRRLLGLPLGRPLALVSFGGYGARDLPLDRLDCTPEWNIIVTTASGEVPPCASGVLTVPEDTLYAGDLQYQDLVGAVDVVITKPGYGIVSDCAANDTALLYTSRGRFPEYAVIVEALPWLVRSHFIPRDDLLAGQWLAALEALRQVPPLRARPRADGADVVARLILGIAGAT